MIPPTSIDGTDITGATIDGTDVQEITVDGQTVFTSTTPHPSGKVAWYAIDTSSTSVVADLTGNNSDATVQSGISSVSDSDLYEGFGLDLPGNAHVELNDDFEVTSDRAIAITFDYQTSQDGSGFFNLQGGWGRVALAFHKTINDKLGVEHDLGEGFTEEVITGTISTGQKYRAVVNADASGGVELYLNNSQETLTTTGADVASGDQYRFGASAGSSSAFQFEGVIDNFIIYDRQLSSSEIQDDFDAQPWS